METQESRKAYQGIEQPTEQDRKDAAIHFAKAVLSDNFSPMFLVLCHFGESVAPSAYSFDSLEAVEAFHEATIMRGLVSGISIMESQKDYFAFREVSHSVLEPRDI